jgi:hypothetical protein
MSFIVAGRGVLGDRELGRRSLTYDLPSSDRCVQGGRLSACFNISVSLSSGRS